MNEDKTSRPALVDEKVAARYIGMSVQFLRKSRCDGNRVGRTPAPNFVKFGRTIRYEIASLDEWIAQHRRDVR